MSDDDFDTEGMKWHHDPSLDITHGPTGEWLSHVADLPCKVCKGKGYTLTRVNVTEMWKRECPVCNDIRERPDK